MPNITYAVFALKKGQVAAVSEAIRGQGLTNVADWVARMGTQLYGSTNDDWKPFGTSTIREILATNGNRFYSATALIDMISDDLSNIAEIFDSAISLYIVDVFSLFLPKYKDLAIRLDLDAARHGSVCLVLQTSLSSDFDLIQGRLIQAYFGQWPQVKKAYAQGSGHRIVMTSEDMTNFREYLAALHPDGPNPSALRRLKGVWGEPDTGVPRIE